VSANRPFDGSEIKFQTLHSGDFFGESALLSDCIRTSTMTAIEKTTCLQLDRKHFAAFFGIAPELQIPIEEIIRSRTVEMVERIPFFSREVIENKPWCKKALLASLFDYEQAQPGDVIVQEGREGSKFHFIVLGCVEMSASLPESLAGMDLSSIREWKLSEEDLDDIGFSSIRETGRINLGVLRAGEYFGEVSLINDGNIEFASIVAKEPCVFLTLTKTKFSKFMSLVPEVQQTLIQTSILRVRKAKRSIDHIVSILSRAGLSKSSGPL
jgi:CRP-like cAMP-binding protein